MNIFMFLAILSERNLSVTPEVIRGADCAPLKFEQKGSSLSL